MDRLSSFPYVVVRVACTFCPKRRGVYRLARLAERFGAEVPLEELIQHLSADCPWQDDPKRPGARRRGNLYVPRCHAHFPDLWHAPPADLPPEV